jgi:HEPN domain-containing protein
MFVSTSWLCYNHNRRAIGRQTGTVTVDIQESVDYWRASALSDWKAARALFEKRRYPQALFFGHLYLEKMLKAVIVHRTRTHAPYGHRLAQLAETARLEISPELRRLLVEVTAFNLETRYPEEQVKLYHKYNRKYCEGWLREIRKVGKWLESLLR